MDANEQKARELYAAEFEKTGNTHNANTIRTGKFIFDRALEGNAIRAIMAALAQQVPADGEWVLVPREPTPGMLHFVIGDTHSEGQSYYAAMLAATPQAPQPVVDDRHIETLCKVRALLQSTKGLQGREHVSLGMAFNEAIGHFMSATQPQQGAVEVSGFVATIPDNCDRVIWRGGYHQLRAHPPTIGQQAVDDATRLSWLLDRVEVDHAGVTLPCGRKRDTDRAKSLRCIDAALAAHGKGG